MAGAPLELIAVEVRADLDQLQAQMPGAARVVDQSMDQVGRSLVRAEQQAVRSGAVIGRSFDQASMRSRMLGYQIADVGVQLSAGTSPFLILAQQAPQVANALEGVGGVAGRLAVFFSGPWGAALLAAASVAGVLVGKLWETEDAADAAAAAAARYTEAMANLGTLKFTGQNSDDILRRAADLGRQAAALDARVTGSEEFRRNSGLGRQAADLRRQRDELLEQVRRESNPATNPALRIAQRNQARLDAPSTSRGTGRNGKSDADRGAERAAREAEREREQREREAKALDDRYNKTLAQLTLEQQLAELRARGTAEASKLADIREANFRIEQQFPELAASTNAADLQRLATLKLIAAATIEEAYARDQVSAKARDIAGANAARQKEFAERQEKLDEDAARQQEARIRTLGQLYYDAFNGGTERIWDNFKDIGLSVIADVLARFTMSQLGGGGGFDLGGALSAAIGSVLPGFASGGSMRIGGRGGVDRNTLSLNGQPIARVSSGETLSVSNPALSRGGSQPMQIVVQVEANDYFDARVAGISRHVAGPIAVAAASQVGAAVGRAVTKAVPARMAQFQRDGT